MLLQVFTYRYDSTAQVWLDSCGPWASAIFINTCLGLKLCLVMVDDFILQSTTQLVLFWQVLISLCFLNHFTRAYLHRFRKWGNKSVAFSMSYFVSIFSPLIIATALRVKDYYRCFQAYMKPEFIIDLQPIKGKVSTDSRIFLHVPSNIHV